MDDVLNNARTTGNSLPAISFQTYKRFRGVNMSTSLPLTLYIIMMVKNLSSKQTPKALLLCQKIRESQLRPSASGYRRGPLSLRPLYFSSPFLALLRMIRVLDVGYLWILRLHGTESTRIFLICTFVMHLVLIHMRVIAVELPLIHTKIYLPRLLKSSPNLT